MKNLFPGYHRPTEEEFQQMWQECIFAFDANMLLNIYRYTPETQEVFFVILEHLKDRIWIPHQAAYEYSKNRTVVIEGQLKNYDEIESLLDDAYAKLAQQLATYKRHVSVNIGDVLDSIRSGITKAKESLENNKQHHPDLSSSDPLGDRISALLDGKVGPEFNSAKLVKIYEEAELRFRLLKPPGFKDAKGKEYPDKYGDVVMWFQLIEYAKTQRKPIILVTDDRKDDWWQKDKGETVSPRPELINEIQNEARINFYMYPSEQFIKYARQFLKLDVHQTAIQEVESVRKEDEAYQSAYDYFATQNSISRRVLENAGSFDNLLIRRAAEAARALDNPLTRQAIETTKALDSSLNNPSIRKALEDARSLDNPLMRHADEAARALNNPQTRHIIEAAKSLDNPLTRHVAENVRWFDNPSMRYAAEAARLWQRNPLSGLSIPRDINIDISPKRLSDLQDTEGSQDVKVEVLLDSESEDSSEDETIEGVEDFDERAATQPYEFNNIPLTVTLIHEPDSPRSFETSHRLRKPALEEWEEWSRNIEYSRRYYSSAEIDEHNAELDEDEEKATEIWEPFYSEWKANELLYNKLILEIAGVKLDKEDKFPADEFRELPPEMIEKLRVGIKISVITRLYRCYCRLEKPVPSDGNGLRVNQNIYLNSSTFNVTHILRQPTEDESYYFRTNIVRGYFSTNEENQEIIELKLNLPTAVEFYNKLIMNIENATVGGRPFSDETRNAFLEAINPVYKLRVLEPLFKVNAWYFKIDEIIMP